jgi:hypothetical protein
VGRSLKTLVHYLEQTVGKFAHEKQALAMKKVTLVAGGAARCTAISN